LAATAAVALLIWQWRPLSEPIWTVENPAAWWLLTGAFCLGWVTLLVSTFLINHFELFGLEQAYYAWRGREIPKPKLRTPALYRLVRHPLYFSFLVAFWATPRMTVGHLLFAAGATGYILIGVLFEERDLVAQFGDAYRRYQQRVPMVVPGFTFARRRREEDFGERLSRSSGD
jgi:protein-S-isoprenylcysteine O-methyltransferase Ste14